MQFDGAVANDTLFADFGTYEEIQYSTAAKGAESPNTGVSVSFTIKSGGNDFHGSVYGSYQPGRFQSNNVDQALLNRGYLPGSNKYTHYDDWDYEVGGPVFKWIDIISPKMTLDASVNRAGYWWPDVPWTRDVRRTDVTTGANRGEFQVTYRRPIRWGWNSTWSWFRDIGGKNNEIKSGV